MTDSEQPDEGIQVHEGRRAGVVISVRLKPEEADLLEGLAERDGRSLSETLRVALHAFSRQPLAQVRLDRGIAAYTRGGQDLDVPSELRVLSHS